MPDVDQDRREWAWDVARALDRLDDDHRRTVLLVYVEHRSHQEVALRMGVAASLVGARMTAALRSLSGVPTAP